MTETAGPTVIPFRSIQRQRIAANRLVDFLLLMGSKQPHKIDDYAAISAAYFRNHNVLAEVRALTEFIGHHSAVEDGDRTQNSNKKLRAAEEAVRSLRDDNRRNPLLHFIDRLRSERLSFVNRSFDSKRIRIGSDDTTSSLPTVIWDRMLPTLRSRVEASALVADIHEIDGISYASVRDIGPIMAAVGAEDFWNTAREAALSEGLTEVKIHTHVTCYLKSPAVPEAPAEKFEGHSVSYLFAPNGLAEPLRKPVNAPLATSEHFLCLPHARHRAIAEDMAGYIVNDVHNARAQAFSKIVQSLNGATKKVSLEIIRAKREACTPEVVPPAQGLWLVQPSLGAQRGRIGDLEVVQQAQTRQSFSASIFYDHLSMNFVLGGNREMQHADALLFAPFNPADSAQLAYNNAMVCSAIVAKQLDPRYAHVPVVMQNLNGCYNGIIRQLKAYINSGFCNDFLRRTGLDLPAKVRHLPLYFIDVVSGSSQAALDDASARLFNKRLKGYCRVEAETEESVSGGHPAPEGLFTISEFGSATSIKLKLNQSAAEMSAFAADIGAGLRWGAGDQYTMGAIAEGFRRTGGLYLEGTSTYALINNETKHGEMPPCDHWHLHQTIGPRIRDLFESNVMISLSGGAGTGQEGAALLALKLFAPELMQGKSLVLVGQGLAKQTELAGLLGIADAKRLSADPFAFADRVDLLFPDRGRGQAFNRRIEESIRSGLRCINAVTSKPLHNVAYPELSAVLIFIVTVTAYSCRELLCRTGPKRL